jgi:hypothetical protein
MTLGPHDAPPTRPMIKVAQADAHGHRLFAETHL